LPSNFGSNSPAHENAPAPDDSARPGELAPEYGKPERDHDDRGARQDDHGHADEQHRYTDDSINELSDHRHSVESEPCVYALLPRTLSHRERMMVTRGRFDRHGKMSRNGGYLSA
jgi:hypothetical protein